MYSTKFIYWGIRFALIDAICCVSTNPVCRPEARVTEPIRPPYLLQILDAGFFCSKALLELKNCLGVIQNIFTQVSHPFYLSKALNSEGRNKFLKQNIMPVTLKTAPIYKHGTVLEMLYELSTLYFLCARQ
jgi:hypothetical protein